MVHEPNCSLTASAEQTCHDIGKECTCGHTQAALKRLFPSTRFGCLCDRPRATPLSHGQQISHSEQRTPPHSRYDLPSAPPHYSIRSDRVSGCRRHGTAGARPLAMRRVRVGRYAAFLHPGSGRRLSVMELRQCAAGFEMLNQRSNSPMRHTLSCAALSIALALAACTDPGQPGTTCRRRWIAGRGRRSSGWWVGRRRTRRGYRRVDRWWRRRSRWRADHATTPVLRLLTSNQTCGGHPRPVTALPVG